MSDNLSEMIGAVVADGARGSGVLATIRAMVNDRDNRIADLDCENERLRAALAELLACKELKDTIGDDSPHALAKRWLANDPALKGLEILRSEYYRRDPLAWAKAREALK